MASPPSHAHTHTHIHTYPSPPHTHTHGHPPPPPHIHTHTHNPPHTHTHTHTHPTTNTQCVRYLFYALPFFCPINLVLLEQNVLGHTEHSTDGRKGDSTEHHHHPTCRKKYTHNELNNGSPAGHGWICGKLCINIYRRQNEHVKRLDTSQICNAGDHTLHPMRSVQHNPEHTGVLPACTQRHWKQGQLGARCKWTGCVKHKMKKMIHQDTKLFSTVRCKYALQNSHNINTPNYTYSSH